MWDRGTNVSDRDQLASELQQLVLHIRAHVPDAVINTRLALGDESGIVMHAQIIGGAGSSAGAHASSEAGDGAAELAENRALARAIIAMGLPPMAEPTPTRLHSVPSVESTSRVVQFPKSETEQAETPEAFDTDDGDIQIEDISWTEFWKWARSYGFANKLALETAIGQSIDRLTPAEARRMAMASRADS